MSPFSVRMTTCTRPVESAAGAGAPGIIGSASNRTQIAERGRMSLPPGAPMTTEDGADAPAGRVRLAPAAAGMLRYRPAERKDRGEEGRMNRRTFLRCAVGAGVAVPLGGVGYAWC